MSATSHVSSKSVLLIAVALIAVVQLEEEEEWIPINTRLQKTDLIKSAKDWFWYHLYKREDVREIENPECRSTAAKAYRKMDPEEYSFNFTRINCVSGDLTEKELRNYVKNEFYYEYDPNEYFKKYAKLTLDCSIILEPINDAETETEDTKPIEKRQKLELARAIARSHRQSAPLDNNRSSKFVYKNESFHCKVLKVPKSPVSELLKDEKNEKVYEYLESMLEK